MQGHDGVLRSEFKDRKYHLIGNYAGWNKDAIYIAGYNHYHRPDVSDAKKVYFGQGKVVIDLNSGDTNSTGNITAKNHPSTSDQRLKQNIQPLASSLSKLAQLRGVSFNWKDDQQDNQIGLVAQEVEKVLPEIVYTDSEGYKSIAYGKLGAVLLEAIKEQQLQIDKLSKQLEQK